MVAHVERVVVRSVFGTRRLGVVVVASVEHFLLAFHLVRRHFHRLHAATVQAFVKYLALVAEVARAWLVPLW